jgi:hypothetical protein
LFRKVASIANITPYNEHWTLGVSHNILGDASDYHMSDASASQRAHDDHVVIL